MVGCVSRLDIRLGENVMKMSGLRWNCALIVASLPFIAAIIILLNKGSYSKDLLWILICFPVCFIMAIFGITPQIIINRETGVVETSAIPDERYKRDKKYNNNYTHIYISEVESCTIEKHRLIITLKHGHVRVLYLYLFSKGQIRKIKQEIDNLCQRYNERKIQ